MIKNILFDLDGTLLDTNDIIINSLRATAKQFLKRDLSEDEIRSVYGKVLNDQMLKIAEFVSEELPVDHMVKYYRDAYTKNRTDAHLFPGINQMLENLKELGCNMAIVSSKNRRGLDYCLSEYRLDRFIKYSVAAQDSEKHKPDAQPVLMALKQLDGNAEETVMVGDSKYDIMSGKNAGVKTALVEWTMLPLQELMELKPDYLLKTPANLVELVKYPV